MSSSITTSLLAAGGADTFPCWSSSWSFMSAWSVLALICSLNWIESMAYESEVYSCLQLR